MTPYTAYSHGAALSQLKLVTRPMSEKEKQQFNPGKIGSDGQVITPLAGGGSAMHLSMSKGIGQVNSAGVLQEVSDPIGGLATSTATAVMRIGKMSIVH